MNEWIAWVPSALLTLVVVALALAVARLRGRVVALERAAHTSPGLETVASATSSTSEAALTDVAPFETPRPSAPQDKQQPSPNPASLSGGRIAGSLFADLVLRESVVRSASFVHGVRRAVAPETRNRIRFQMRQEVKRSRKQRRADLRARKRHLADQRRKDAA